jgi:uncharacterized SAM-binding protein YcdF (DUF218 family)
MVTLLGMITVASLAIAIVTWFMLSIAVGIAARKRCNRFGFDWFVFALLFSPLVAAAWLYALGYNNREPDQKARAVTVAVVAAILILTVLYNSIGHAQQTTVRDSSGRTVGTVSTDSQGTRTFRDASGRTTGTATRDSSGTTTFRDSQGRTTGTASGNRR